MFETSPSTEKLDIALAKVQGEIKPALKDSANPFFNSTYADLAAVWEVARAPLSKHGVNITQWPVSSTDGRLTLVTRLAHAGEWMKCTFSIPVVKQDPQGFGSATTYARRFTLMAALGIAPVDDDGNHATGHSTRPPLVQTNVPQPQPSKPTQATRIAPKVSPVKISEKSPGKEPSPPAWTEDDIPF